MTDKQLNNLTSRADGDTLSDLPVGFIINSPRQPRWYGITLLDYFSNDALWLKANLAAHETFPEVNLTSSGFRKKFKLI